MEEYIYKYISFAQFVDLVQTKSLCFATPSKWEDKHEMYFLHKWYGTIESTDALIGQFFESFLFAQCWTNLEESDAMWRLYSFNKQALRIKILKSDVSKLKDVYLVPVVYEDEQIQFEKGNIKYDEIMLKLASQKRKAFEHEKEVRLIHIPKYNEDQLNSGFETMLFLAKFMDNKIDDNMLNYSEEKIKNDIEAFNLNHKKQTEKIKFDHIPNFIRGIMVHPMASKWYVKTVETYCNLNNIPFEGQSDLYKEVDQ